MLEEAIEKCNCYFKLKTIADHYGYDTQSRQLIEEMSELVQAINKFWRKNLEYGKIDFNIVEDSSEKNQIIEEIADVIVMITQISILLDADEDIITIMKNKIDRQLERINKECGTL